MNKSSLSQIILFVALFFLTFLFRTVWHLGANIEFVTCAMILSSYYLGKKSTFWLVLLIMVCTDLVLGNTNIFIFTWTGFLIPTIVFPKLFQNSKFKIQNLESLGIHIISGLGASIFFLAIVLITKGRGMGLGDVKLVFVMGLILGWPKILAALFLAFVSGALVGIGLVIAGRAKMKTQIPFGTFLAASTFLVMLWGDAILAKYFSLLML